MKLPFSFSLKFVFRLFLPGFIVAVGFVPILQPILQATKSGPPIEWAVLLMSIVLGWLFVVLDMHIYMIFEGRRYWPRALRKLFVRCEKRRLQRLQAIVKKSQVNDRDRYLEASVELRQFPMDDGGAYIARAPTKIGNLILAFESYSLRTYGMDAIFFWPRLWLLLDESQRKEIDDQQAMADSVVYSAGALFLNAAIFSIYSICAYVEPSLLGRSFTAFLVVAGACLVTGYLLYRVALQVQASFGETFKAVFDCFRDKIDLDEVINQVRQEWPEAVADDLGPAQRNQIAWRYLHNFRVRIGTDVVSAGRESLDDSEAD